MRRHYIDSEDREIIEAALLLIAKLERTRNLNDISNAEKLDDVADRELLGDTETVTDINGEEIVLAIGLEENLLAVDDAVMNEPFKKWKAMLGDYNRRLVDLRQQEIEFMRLELGSQEAFDFLGTGVKVDVLGPIPEETPEGKKGLRFLRQPPKGPRSSEEFMSTDDEEFGTSPSAGHTINGHSIVLRLRYGGFTFLLAGDLNDEAERILTRAHNLNEINLQAEVLKVPHHGSHDFSGAFLDAVQPMISVVSPGDESARKEYVHPRATLIGALGRFLRVDEPIILITELVAFFKTEGFIDNRYHSLSQAGVQAVAGREDVVDTRTRERFYAFSRAAFGIVMIRTDGVRLLVYTNSALEDMKEAYALKMNDLGKPEPVELRRV